MNQSDKFYLAKVALAAGGSFIIAFLIALPAKAQTYVEARGGGAWLQDGTPADGADSIGAVNGANVSFDAGAVVMIAVGRDFTGPFSAEIEYGYRKSSIDGVSGSVANPAPPPIFVPFTGTISGDVAISTLMLNGLANTAVANGPISIYAGVGAGIAFTDTEFDGLAKNDTRFAFQTMLGASYSISPAVSVTAGYNLLVVESVEFGNDEIDITAQSVLVGARFNF